MIAVLISAILLSLPIGMLEFLAISATIVAIMILIPMGLAPPGRRFEAAYWAMALHPLAFLIWLWAWRLPGYRPSLGPTYVDPFLEWPRVLAFLSRFYHPIAGALGWLLAEYRFQERSVVKPLAVLPIVWLTTIGVLESDPFELRSWVLD